jgi:hypothetical protein
MMQKFYVSILAIGISLAVLCSCKSVVPQYPPKEPEPSFYTITINGKVPYVVGEPELNTLIKEKSLERYREFEEAAKSAGIRIVNSDEAAETGAEATKAMTAKKGRAKFLGEKSRGFKDAGAASMCTVISAMARYCRQD